MYAMFQKHTCWVLISITLRLYSLYDNILNDYSFGWPCLSTYCDIFLSVEILFLNLTIMSFHSISLPPSLTPFKSKKQNRILLSVLFIIIDMHYIKDTADGIWSFSTIFITYVNITMLLSANIGIYTYFIPLLTL